MSTTVPPFTRLPDSRGMAEALSDLVAHDPDWSTRPGVTVGRGLLRDRDGTVLDAVIASENRPDGRFAYLVVVQSAEGSGDWRSGGCLMDHAAEERLTAVLRSITGGEGRYP